MCQFISAVIPADTDQVSLKPLLDKYGMSFKEIKNTFVDGQLGGDMMVRATRSVCDCNTVLGSDSRLQKIDQTILNHSDEIYKLTKKGWSKHKIERWLAEKFSSADRGLKKEIRRADTELGQWCEFISMLLETGVVKRIGFLLHEYNSPLDEERIQIKRVDRLTVSDRLGDDLMAMEDDVLYTFLKI
jgi:hypothetical protein